MYKQKKNTQTVVDEYKGPAGGDNKRYRQQEQNKTATFEQKENTNR